MSQPPNLGHFTVGFVQPVGDRGEPFGSGTLIDFGQFNGILTAAHVLDKIKEVGEIGILEFPVRATQAQRLRTHFDHLDFVRIGQEPYSEHGPDLAFLKLPLSTATALKANSSFVSFQRQAAMAFADAPKMGKLDAVMGVIESWRRDQIAQPSLIITPVQALGNVGTAVPIDPTDAYDRFEFTPLESQDFTPPDTYGGTSGGGLWRSYRRKNPDESIHFDETRLLGVAFFQSGKAEGQRKIICHGPKSVYGVLAERIREKWEA